TIVQEIFSVDPSLLTTHHSLLTTQGTIWRDDITASPCFLVIVDRAKASNIWKQLIHQFSIEQEHQPAKRRLRPVGWAAFNATRIEAGRALAGIDYETSEPSMPGKKKDQESSEAAPASIGLLPAELNDVDRVVDFNKGCYLGQEVVARMHARKVVARKIVGWRADDDALPIAGAPITNEAGEQIGIVTSSTLSPRLGNIAIGLAIVKKPHFTPDSTLHIPAEGAIRKVRVVETPFIR
ncbi:MAG TPA: glycine cleavage T C-terminal barrel domain-containing protein, partial [Tepidisphaeraceae bacterium]|nr:glycine cleavage T C-terminal barrel domain-containing protein [Tepidisphaeraceae bacterium]